MSDDPLDKTTSIGAELTQSGLNLNAKSRTVAAIDRLVGNAFDFLNLPLEKRNTEQRTKIEGRKQLVEAIRDHALTRMKTDPNFAERMSENYIRSMVERQENKDHVVRHAIEDLRRDGDADDSGTVLDPEFLNRLERHAEDAVTEQAREKWGRALATEIRRPGTITLRTMRIIDEIDAQTAQIFEKFCEYRISNVVPKCLCEPLSFLETTKLVGSGLLIDPGTGQIRKSMEFMNGATDSWIIGFNHRGVSIPKTAPIPARPPRQKAQKECPLIHSDGKLAVPVYVLTDEALAVSQILPNKEEEMFDRYAANVADFLNARVMVWLAKETDGMFYPQYELVPDSLTTDTSMDRPS